MPSRELQAPEKYNPIPVSTRLAREWALGTGRAELVDDDLRSHDDVDTIGEAIVTIGNSEREQEDFGLVYHIVARSRAAAVLSEQVLKEMVVAAEERYGDTWQRLEMAA